MTAMNRSTRSLFILLLAALCSPFASAMPLYDGSYALSDAGGNSNRGLWTNGPNFTTVSGSFDVSGVSAVLSGEVTNAGVGGGFTFSVAMDFLCSAAVSDLGGNNVDPGCGGLPSQPTGGAVSGAEADGEIWDFWNWSGPATLEGTGSLAGLTVDISQAPTNNSKPFRVGIAANWDDDDVLGASGWISVGNFDCAAGAACQGGFPGFSAADFNFSFTPVPAPGILGLLALIGLAGLRPRRG